MELLCGYKMMGFEGMMNSSVATISGKRLLSSVLQANNHCCKGAVLHLQYYWTYKCFLSPYLYPVPQSLLFPVCPLVPIPISIHPTTIVSLVSWLVLLLLVLML